MPRVIVSLLAVVIGLVCVAPAAAQLEAPEGLFFAEIPDEIKSLVEQAYVASPAEQSAAVGKLAAMGAEAAPAVPYLIQLLSEKIDLTLRTAAVDALAKIGAPAVEATIGGLKAATPEARSSAAEVLKRLADKQATEPLTAVALSDSSAIVRDKALAALAALAASDPTVSEKLLATAQDAAAKAELRGRAIKALGRLAGPAAPVDALVTMLENEEEDIRLRCAAAAALGRSSSVEAVNPLIKALADKKTPVRLWAAIALNGNSDPAAIAGLIKLLSDENDRVRVRAADGLAAVADPKTIEPLTKALSDTNAEVRTWAVVGLGNFSDPKVLEPLRTALSDAEPQVRIQAADALGRTRDPKATALLVGTLNKFSEEIEVRCAAARALGTMRDSRAVPTLIGLLRDNDATLRRWAASALGRIGDARAVEPLVAALDDSDATVKAWVLKALARFDDPRAKAAVQAAGPAS